MANLDFYALGNDLRRVFDFLYSETDVVVYELPSEPNSDIRRFNSVAELADTYDLGGPKAVHLQLWSLSVMARPVIRRIEVKSPENYIRYDVGGVGLMQLYLSGIRDGAIYHTHFGHWNEARAKQRSAYPASDCDWRALAKVSGKIQRHIRGKLAAAKFRSRPVLHQAWAMVQQGHGLRWNAIIHHADSPDIRRIA
jgi:hypothetical protein